jgi:hypothetical protein
VTKGIYSTALSSFGTELVKKTEDSCGFHYRHTPYIDAWIQTLQYTQFIPFFRWHMLIAFVARPRCCWTIWIDQLMCLNTHPLVRWVRCRGAVRGGRAGAVPAATARRVGGGEREVAAAARAREAVVAGDHRHLQQRRPVTDRRDHQFSNRLQAKLQLSDELFFNLLFSLSLSIALGS